MSTKHFILLGTLLGAVFFISAEAQSNNLSLGDRVIGDQLLLQTSVEEEYKFLQKVSLEKTFSTTGGTKITRVEALDRKTDGTGAYVTVLGGGVGENYVSLRFKSQRNHGIHFVVNLYGR